MCCAVFVPQPQRKDKSKLLTTATSLSRRRRTTLGGRCPKGACLYVPGLDSQNDSTSYSFSCPFYRYQPRGRERKNLAQSIGEQMAVLGSESQPFQEKSVLFCFQRFRNRLSMKSDCLLKKNQTKRVLKGGQSGK